MHIIGILLEMNVHQCSEKRARHYVMVFPFRTEWREKKCMHSNTMLAAVDAVVRGVSLSCMHRHTHTMRIHRVLCTRRCIGCTVYSTDTILCRAYGVSSTKHGFIFVTTNCVSVCISNRESGMKRNAYSTIYVNYVVSVRFTLSRFTFSTVASSTKLSGWKPKHIHSLTRRHIVYELFWFRFVSISQTQYRTHLNTNRPVKTQLQYRNIYTPASEAAIATPHKNGLMQHVCVIWLASINLKWEENTRERKKNGGHHITLHHVHTKHTLWNAKIHRKPSTTHRIRRWNKPHRSKCDICTAVLDVIYLVFYCFSLVQHFVLFSEIFNRLGSDHIVSQFFCSISNSIENNALRTRGKSVS